MIITSECFLKDIPGRQSWGSVRSFCTPAFMRKKSPCLKLKAGQVWGLQAVRWGKQYQFHLSGLFSFFPSDFFDWRSVFILLIVFLGLCRSWSTLSLDMRRDLFIGNRYSNCRFSSVRSFFTLRIIPILADSILFRVSPSGLADSCFS